MWQIRKGCPPLVQRDRVPGYPLGNEDGSEASRPKRHTLLLGSRHLNRESSTSLTTVLILTAGRASPEPWRHVQQPLNPADRLDRTQSDGVPLPKGSDNNR